MTKEKQFQNSENVTETGYKRYQLINYFDVWGNEDEGFEVNNQCIEFDDLIISDDSTNEEIFQFMKDISFFNKTAKFESIEFDNSYMDGWEIVLKNGCPVCRIEEYRM